MGLSFMTKAGPDYFMAMTVDELNEWAEEAIKLYGKKQ